MTIFFSFLFLSSQPSTIKIPSYHTNMESARDLVSRGLPAIPFETGAFYQSPSPDDRVPSDWIRPWTSFTTDILETLQTLDLSGKVDHIEPSEDEQNYVVGNKLGLLAQLIRHVCEPVAKALSVTPLKGILFGDAETANPLFFDGPGITLFGDIPGTEPESWKTTIRPVIAVGKVKTFWTFLLEYARVEGRASDLNRSLEGLIGECQLQIYILLECKLTHIRRPGAPPEKVRTETWLPYHIQCYRFCSPG